MTDYHSETEEQIERLRTIMPPDDVYLALYSLILGYQNLEGIMHTTLSQGLMDQILGDDNCSKNISKFLNVLIHKLNESDPSIIHIEDYFEGFNRD